MIIYCTWELEWVIVCDEDKSMTCTDKFLNVSKIYTWRVTSCWEEGKVLSCQIQIVQELLYEISVYGDVPDLYPLYFHCMINYCSTFISYWQKILNLTVFGFLALDGFHLFFIFSNIDQKKKCQQRHYIFGVCSSWPGFSFKMCNFSEFDEDWRSEQHIK